MQINSIRALWTNYSFNISFAVHVSYMQIINCYSVQTVFINFSKSNFASALSFIAMCLVTLCHSSIY